MLTTLKRAAALLVVATTWPAAAQAQRVWDLTFRFTIGSLDGPITFGRIGDITVKSTGEILVLDDLDGTIQVFGPDGTPRTRFGGRGEGPGELSEGWNELILTDRDEVVIPDPINARVTYFSTNYDVSHSYRLGQFTMMAAEWAPMGDSLLMQVLPFGMPGGTALSEEAKGGIEILDREGREQGRLVTFSHPGWYTRSFNGRIRIPVYHEEPIWGRAPGSTIAHGSTGVYRLAIVSRDGSVSRVIERTVERQHTTDEIRSATEERFRQADAEAETPSSIERIPVLADSLPLIKEIRLGPQETLLVGRDVGLLDAYRRELDRRVADELPPTFDVFGSGGLYLGVLELPVGFSLRAARGNRLYGIVLDEFDVEYVTVYEVGMVH